MPEIREHYGEGVDIEVILDVIPNGDNIITLNAQRGLVFGDKDDVLLIFSIMASNDTIDNEEAC